MPCWLTWLKNWHFRTIMKTPYGSLSKPFLALAPLDEVSDTVFRQIIASCARPDLFFTEFTNVDALQSAGRESALKRLRHEELERPLIAQIWGKDPKNFYKSAQELVKMGFAGVDLNMGCPAKSEVKAGTCSALINNRPLAEEVIRATKEGLGGQLPISVKTRVGFSAVDMSWIEFLLGQDLDMLIVHGRTRKEMSKVPANWDLIGQAATLRDKIAPNTLIVGNGDVENYQMAQDLAKKYGLDGIMIGRGVFHDPFVFAKNSPWPNYTKQQKIQLYKSHVELFLQTWQSGERKLHTLNKFCKIYISGFDGAKEMRDKLMHANSGNELLDLLQGYSEA